MKTQEEREYIPGDEFQILSNLRPDHLLYADENLYHHDNNTIKRFCSCLKNLSKGQFIYPGAGWMGTHIK